MGPGDRLVEPPANKCNHWTLPIVRGATRLRLICPSTRCRPAVRW